MPENAHLIPNWSHERIRLGQPPFKTDMVVPLARMVVPLARMVVPLARVNCKVGASTGRVFAKGETGIKGGAIQTSTFFLQTRNLTALPLTLTCI